MVSLSVKQPQNQPHHRKSIRSDSKSSSLRKFPSCNGFEDYALNIEDKIMRIKRAQTIDIYKAHKETGEDLVNEAHPDGDL